MFMENRYACAVTRVTDLSILYFMIAACQLLLPLVHEDLLDHLADLDPEDRGHAAQSQTGGRPGLAG